LARLLDPSIAWGSVTPAEASTFTPDGYLVRVAPAGPAGADAVAWPLATAPAEFGSVDQVGVGVDGLRVGTVTGADALTLATALASAPAMTPLVADGQGWSAWIRPILPYETAP
jgi:hypothetical protein